MDSNLGTPHANPTCYARSVDSRSCCLPFSSACHPCKRSTRRCHPSCSLFSTWWIFWNVRHGQTLSPSCAKILVLHRSYTSNLKEAWTNRSPFTGGQPQNEVSLAKVTPRQWARPCRLKRSPNLMLRHFLGDALAKCNYCACRTFHSYFAVIQSILNRELPLSFF